MAGLFPKKSAEVLAGVQNNEDAGVFRVSEDLALVQTLDFLTPMVDEPRDFGRIAAANALSDVYAMGGRPVTAMNIVCFPSEELSEELLKEILAGGLEKIEEAGAFLLGGHSVDDKELKYGLSVTGLVHPERMVTNGGARENDVLILTKPLGTGVLATAVKGKIASKKASFDLVHSMARLNNKASEVFLRFEVHAMTDITGFGLAGHGLEMARAAKALFEVDTKALPFLPEARNCAEMGLIPAGAYRNREFCGGDVLFAPGIPRVMEDLVMDPQTSGGLLGALSETKALACLEAMKNEGLDAAIIGRVKSPGKDRCGLLQFV